MENKNTPTDIFSVNSAKQYAWLVNGSAVGFYFLLTSGVLYTCFYVAYENVFEDQQERLYNSLYLLYVLFNMMGNYILGVTADSSFKRGNYEQKLELICKYTFSVLLLQ